MGVISRVSHVGWIVFVRGLAKPEGEAVVFVHIDNLKYRCAKSTIRIECRIKLL